MSLINEIQNQLRFQHHLPDGAVTQAIAYVIFNTHASTLVNDGKVTREMAYEAALHVRSLAHDAAQLVAPARDLRILVAHYISRSGGSGGVVKTEIHLYGSLAQCAPGQSKLAVNAATPAPVASNSKSFPRPPKNRKELNP